MESTRLMHMKKCRSLHGEYLSYFGKNISKNLSAHLNSGEHSNYFIFLANAYIC